MSLIVKSQKAKHASVLSRLFLSTFGSALSRRRVRCTLDTQYDDHNLMDYLQGVIPEWIIRLVGTDAGLSQFPSDDNITEADQVCIVADFLKVDTVVAKDRMNGHCETIAVLMAEIIENELTRTNGDTDVCRALANQRETINGLSFDEQVKRIFKAEEIVVNHEDYKKSSAKQHDEIANLRTVLFWPSTAIISPNHVAVESWCAGGPETAFNLAKAASHAVCNKSTLMLPLYLMCYVYDGDELNDLEMKQDVETALYSVHVLALVLDGRNKTCYLCDPNGKFIKGSNMEYINIPCLPRLGKATTCVSKSDMEASEIISSNSKRRANKRKRL